MYANPNDYTAKAMEPLVRGGNFAGGFAAEATGRMLEVPHQLDALERNVKGVMQGLDTLESRLSESILRSVGSMPTGDGSKMPTPVQNTHVGGRLYENNSALAALNERIQGLIARLEA